MNVKLRKLQDSDKEAYLNLENGIWVNKKMLQTGKENDSLWNSMFSDLCYEIRQRSSGAGIRII